MALVDPAKIRNMAVVGHRGAGKTSLVEALAVHERRQEPPGKRDGRHHHHGPRRG